MVIEELKKLTGHRYLVITERGDAAIEAALKGCENVLIPEEGGWLSYRKLPKKVTEVLCDDAKINLNDLRVKLEKGKFDAFLYHSLGGYFAEEPIQEIFEVCHEKGCKVIMDVSGSIGTDFCKGEYADVIVCSFRRWKLIDALVGGFISSNSKLNVESFEDAESFKLIDEKIKRLQERIKFLFNRKRRVVKDLGNLNIAWPDDLGFVVVVKYADLLEREKVINYCAKKHLEWTECPRYIRINEKAISIEIKRL